MTLSETVLVTGGSGYLGAHCVLQLLKEGYNVRTTVRDIGKEGKLRKALELLKVDDDTLQDNFKVYVADLTKDGGWKEALSGCDYVLHVASPVPSERPKDELTVILPAVEGTLRVIKLSEKAGVKKLVFTSCFAAIGYGHPDKLQLSEKDWASPAKVDEIYARSKILAEKAAWDHVKSSKSKMRFTVINPAGIWGPPLPGCKPSALTGIILEKLLTGDCENGCPKFNFGVADVRDLSMIHVQAMTMSSTDNERYIVASQETDTNVLDFANLLKNHIDAERASKLPKTAYSKFILRVVAISEPDVRKLLPSIRGKKSYSTKKARKAFDWVPIDQEKSLIDSVRARDSLVASL